MYVYRSLVACVVRLSIAALLRNLMWSAHRITWYIIHKCFTAQSWDTNEGAKKEKEKSLFLFLSGDAGCGSGKGVCEGGSIPFVYIHVFLSLISLYFICACALFWVHTGSYHLPGQASGFHSRPMMRSHAKDTSSLKIGCSEQCTLLVYYASKVKYWRKKKEESEINKRNGQIYNVRERAQKKGRDKTKRKQRRLHIGTYKLA